MPDHISTRLRESIKACRALDRSVLLAEAADEIERLTAQRNHWIATAHAFDEHLATMRVMLMEQPGVRFGASLVCGAIELTAAERGAIADAADRYAEITPESAETAATLRGLLERLK